MNKGICDKLKLVLWGLSGRIEENIDYIRQVKFTFVTGLKKIEGEYLLDKKAVIFNGKEEDITIGNLPDYISKEALNYDSLEFVLEERGSAVVVTADAKEVKTKKLDKLEKKEDKSVFNTSQVLKRNYLIKIGEADDLLREIGVLTKEGKVKNDMIRKYNQIDHFVELIDSMIDEVSKGTETVTILDCGCGKSYLTFVLNYYIKEKKKKNCYFIGVDRSEEVIESSKKIAKKLGYKNMEFIADDINFYEPSRRVDIVLSLHACDTATDMALGLGVRLKSKAIMCVPCCHKELLSQYRFKEFDSILKHGIFKTKFADILTDGVRSLLLESQGYKVSVVEYISPLETPKNILIRAYKVSDKNEKALDEYMKLREMFSIYPSLETYIDVYED
ncbi:class I SAM-dependent methyltransferase [Clostridium cylindrosporum]|uniref:Methyltransferase domain n=1 Tax=Clostridium cylindrosporum DSM 605 TaxID=1121307 RepID=A0A0J8FZ11_CLOCY|nr:SAM-dependent methyltransferase [Clostridium cylindrosporum]KMT20861.1 methyltransferase domain [Clostridium cylindrosporum DSM 605]